MDLHQLQLFLAVMDSPSVTRAAENVRLSPGAISLQIHKLADELRTDLFVRNGKRLNPTPAAFRLAEHARFLLRLTSQIKQEFETDVGSDTQPFQLSTGVTTLIYQLGKPLEQLRKQYPAAEIRVSVNPTEETIAGLHSRRFDLGLVTLPVPQDGLKIAPLFEEELLLLRPAKRPDRGGPIGVLRPADLTSVPFLLYPKRSNLRQIIDSRFREIGLTPHVVMEADDTEAIKRLVESGFGYSVLPANALRHGAEGFFQTFRILGCRMHRILAIAMVRTDYPRKLTEAVANSLEQMLKPREGFDP
jgi:DNA-binding transcriptional LysR family regulator